MLGKGSRPLMGKLPEPLNPTKKIGFFSDVVMSPKSPLDFNKIRSPRGLKNCEPGAVGLAIVAALEKSGTGNDEIPAKYVVGSLNLNRSDPIPVNNSAKTSTKSRGGLERSDSFACMNSRKADKSGYTILYCDGSEEFTSGFDRRSRKLSFFCESPPRISRVIPAFQTSDFLSSCHLCRKKLHGKDIYMYRGEKAFCSTECRYRQIVIDEHKEKCRSEASRPVDISGSPYNNGGGQIFSTGIIAA